MTDTFLELGAAADLLAIAAAVDPSHARQWISSLVRGNGVRLRDSAGRVLRFNETPEVAALRAARSAAPKAARYNPLDARRRRDTAPASRSRPPTAGDQVWNAGYAVNLGDLETGVYREYEIRVALCPAATAAAALPPIGALSSADPIGQFLDYIRSHCRQSAFEKIPQRSWFLYAKRDGVMGSKAEFKAAWQLALRERLVENLKGPPTRDKQVELVRRTVGAPAIPRKQARGA